MNEKEILLDLEARDDLNDAGMNRLLELTADSLAPEDISRRAWNNTGRLKNEEHQLYMDLQFADKDDSLNDPGMALLQHLKDRDYTTPETLAISAGKGAHNVGYGVMDLINRGVETIGGADSGQFREKVNREFDLFKPLAQRQPAASFVGEVLGEAGPFAGIPAGRAVTIPGKMAQSGALGAAEGSALYAPTMQDRGANALAGGVGAAGFTGAADALINRLSKPADIPQPMVRRNELMIDTPGPSVPPPEAPSYSYWDDRTGVPYTEGQFKNNMGLQQREQRMRYGAFGEPAQQQMDSFLDFQQNRINEAVLGDFQSAVRSGRRGSRDMVPVGVSTVPTGYRTANDAATQFQGMLQNRSDQLWKDIGKAYKASRDAELKVTPEAAQTMLDRLRNTLEPGDLGSPKVNELSHDFINRLEGFWPELQAGQQIESVDLEGLYALRRELSDAVASSKSSDKRNLQLLRRTMDETFAEIVDNPNFVASGDLGAIEELRKGITLRADYGRLYGPQHARYRSGKLKRDPGGLAIENIIEGNISGTEVVNKIFGSGLTLGTNVNTLPVLRRVEDIAGKESQEFQMLRNIALERFRSSVMNNKTDAISIEKFGTKWNTLKKRNPELLTTLFNENSIAGLESLANAIKKAGYKAVNNSQSAHFIEGMLKENKGITPGGMVAGAGAFTYGGDPFVSMLAAGVAPQVGNRIKNMLSGMFGQKAYTSKTKTPPFVTPFGAAVGVETEDRY